MGRARRIGQCKERALKLLQHIELCKYEDYLRDLFDDSRQGKKNFKNCCCSSSRAGLAGPGQR